MNSLILATASHVMFPLLLFFSFFLLVRGHHLPGGGFSGGLVASIAFVLEAIAHGPARARAKLQVDPQRLVGIGLCVMIASGLPPLFRGLPFLTGAWVNLRTPWVELHLGTPLLFDAGVFIAVLGVALSIILSLVED